MAGCIAFYVMSTAIGWTHGTKGSVARSGGYLVTAEYSDGEPMNYAEVKITSPDSDIPFQNGRTDLLGCFLFKPIVLDNGRLRSWMVWVIALPLN